MPKGYFTKNILVIGDKLGQNGEYRVSNNLSQGRHRIICDDGTPDSTRVDRIVGQIKIIGDYAKTQHNPKHLTRVITDEFSFYTKNTPLTIDEYKEIIDKISDGVQDLPANIVLVISSMPVLWPDGTLRNAVLHIQTPKTPQSQSIIHHFSKEFCSEVDHFYSKDGTIKNCYDPQPDDYSSIHWSPNVVLKNTKAQCNDPDQHKNAILIRNIDDSPREVTGIDICFDHGIGVAMRNIFELLQNPSTPPVFYSSHVITSNQISPDVTTLTSTAIHADWLEKAVEGVFEKEQQSLAVSFGTQSRVYKYQNIRTGIIDGKFFDSVAKKTDAQYIASTVDSNNNTLLHQVLFPYKKPINQNLEIYRKKRLDKLLHYFHNNAINQQNLDGNTALHLAVSTINDPNTLMKFLEQGARLNIKNHDGQTPIKILEKENKLALIIELCNKLANNGKVYLSHRNTIEELLDEIPEAPEEMNNMKAKVIISSLCQELAQQDFQVETIISLSEGLDWIAPDKRPVVIRNNFIKLASIAASDDRLYDYLIKMQDFRDNALTVSLLPVETKLKLLKQALYRMINSDVSSGNKLSYDENVKYITMFLTGLDQELLQSQFTHSEYQQLLQYDSAPPSKFSDIEYEELILNEFATIRQNNKLTATSIDIILAVLSQDSQNWNKPYELSKLSIPEYVVGLACRFKEKKLLEKVYFALQNINPPCFIDVPKIMPFLGPNSAKWLTQELIALQKQESDKVIEVSKETGTTVPLGINIGDPKKITQQYKAEIELYTNKDPNTGDNKFKI